jgi:hypothetical protein
LPAADSTIEYPFPPFARRNCPEIEKRFWVLVQARKLGAWRAEGVSAVVSLLTPFEVVELGLQEEAKGLTANQALQAIQRARGVQVPDTEEQRRWVGEFARVLRGGS